MKFFLKFFFCAAGVVELYDASCEATAEKPGHVRVARSVYSRESGKERESESHRNDDEREREGGRAAPAPRPL